MGEAFVTPNAAAGVGVDAGDPEVDIARDLAKKALWVLPGALLLTGLVWGVGGAISTAYAMGIVVLNFGLAAVVNARAAKISPALLGAVAMFGFLLRLTIVFVAFWLTRDASWMKVVPFGLTIVITHVGLLFWEMKNISATLAFPGLKPSDTSPAAASKESSVLLAELEFPSIDNLVKWPNAFTDGFPYLNKIAVIDLVAVILTVAFFLIGNKKQLVPKGAQNLTETAVNFIDEGVIQQTIGHGGEKYIPYLISIFFFVFFTNIFEIIPVFAMPANARMGNPAFLALLTWAFFICVGIKAQGPKYFFNAIFPPGVPKALYILVTPIELISTFIVRPFSLAVRLFANMLAGHILLVTFGVLTLALLGGGILIAISWLPFLMLVALTGFEIMVSFLQAYVFTILAAVYIGGAAHPEH